MTDHGEREIRKWALRRNGDPITNHDVVELVFAFADDFDEAFALRDADTAVLCERVEVLEQWRHESATGCVDRVRKIAAEVAEELHGPTHEAHMMLHHSSPRRADDPPDSEFLEKRETAFPTGDQRTVFEMMLGWSIVKWLIALVVSALIVAGISYWTSSCAAQRVEEEAIGSLEYHFPTASPSP